MALIFYLLLVWISEAVTFSWVWLLVALLFSADNARTVYKYKYTNNPDLVDENVDDFTDSHLLDAQFVEDRAEEK